MKRKTYECGYPVPQVLDGVTNLRFQLSDDGLLSLQMRLYSNGPDAPRGEDRHYNWVDIPIVDAAENLLGYGFKYRLV